MSRREATTVFAHVATTPFELSLEMGDRLVVLAQRAGGWCVAFDPRRRAIGVAPSFILHAAPERPTLRRTSIDERPRYADPSAPPDDDKAAREGRAEREKTRAMKKSLGLDSDDERPHSPGDSPRHSPPSTPAVTPRGGAGGNAAAVVELKEEVDRLRHDCKVLSNREAELRYRGSGESLRVLQDLKRRVSKMAARVQIGAKIHRHAERRIELLREHLDGVFDGQPYDYAELLQLLEDQKQQSQLTGTRENSEMEEFVEGLTSLSPARGGRPPSPVVAPTEEELAADPVAKKLIKKMTKRISQSEETAAEYETQRSKLNRKLEKVGSRIAAMTEELNELRRGREKKVRVEEIVSTVLSSLDAVDEEGLPIINLETTEALVSELEPTLSSQESNTLLHLLHLAHGLATKIQAVSHNIKSIRFGVSKGQSELSKLRKRLSKGKDGEEQLKQRVGALQVDVDAIRERLASSRREGETISERLRIAEDQCRSIVEAERAKRDESRRDIYALDLRIERLRNQSLLLEKTLHELQQQEANAEGAQGEE